MRPEDDPRQMNFEDDIRRRREEVIREGQTASRSTADPTGSASPHDRRRALSRWKTGWLAWDGGGRIGDVHEFTANPAFLLTG
jgi:hypothetical protein